MLDLVLVTTQLLYHRSRIVQSLVKEEILSQSTKQDGGVNFFTGMNDKGISFSGNRKLSTLTGVEEIFDTPVQTVTGEDIGNNSSINVVSPLEGRFSRSVIVEGGSDNKATSEFNGPVIFNEKSLHSPLRELRWTLCSCRVVLQFLESTLLASQLQPQQVTWRHCIPSKTQEGW